ncbi:MAG: thiamine pyrophosphate-binding protein, partial [Pseudomonadota bacterium]
MNNSDLIVKMLKDAGVTHGFGIPSGNVLPFIEAMREGGIEYVLTAHEGSASFAADVVGRATGVPGLCIATLGPGATNLSTGVGSAYLDRSPMIAITCNLNSSLLDRRIQMMIDHHALFAPITKATFAARPDNVAEVMADAIRIALEEPQGPVHIDLPEDVSLAPAAENGEPLSTTPRAQNTAPAEQIDAAANIIAGARRPIVVVGTSAMRMGTPSLLKDFVERQGIPFAATTMAKGMIDDDHPLGIGCIERARRQVQRQFIQGCDLIIGLGYDTVEVEYEAWVGNVPVLSIDIEAPDVVDPVDLAGAVVGDLDDALTRLNALPPGDNDWTAE